MNYLNAKLIKERLPKKGFAECPSGICWYLAVHPCVQIKTSSIDNILEYDNQAQFDILKSLKLGLKDFQELISCNIDKTQYYKKFIEPKLKLEI